MQTDNRTATQASYSWSKPSIGKFKCNVDTTCYIEDNSFCIGACVRDEHGKFLQAYTRRFQGIPTIAKAEATGMREALQWLLNNYRGAADIEVESDCLQVVQAINSMHINATEFGSLIDICRKLLCLGKNCRVSYVRRQANRVAHELAQATCFIANTLQFYNYCPPCIETIIMNEMN
jgi:ribonuclease HI